MIPHFSFNRRYDCALDNERLREYITAIVDLKRGDLTLVEKARAAQRAAAAGSWRLCAERAAERPQVELLTKFGDSAAFFCRPDFVQARGMRYLVEVATAAGSDVDEARACSPACRRSARADYNIGGRAGALRSGCSPGRRRAPRRWRRCPRTGITACAAWRSASWPRRPTTGRMSRCPPAPRPAPVCRPRCGRNVHTRLALPRPRLLPRPRPPWWPPPG